MLAQGKLPVIRRNIGSKLIKMEFTNEAKAGRSVRTVYIGIYGQGPSDNPDFAQWLVGEGIESMSLNPDPVIETWQTLARQ